MKSHSISSREVQQWTLNWLLQAELLKDHGWKCSAAVVWNVVLRAAARLISIYAACRDLADAPSQQGIFNALTAELPKTLTALERRLNGALVGRLPRCMRRRAWEVAVDWHLTPYYGEPSRSRNELYYGRPQQGTSKFHAYASACIVQEGRRYTLAVTYVRRHESTVVALRRLLELIRRAGLKIRCLLLDRAFFHVGVVELLQAENLPFLMPVMFRGRPPKRKKQPSSPGKDATGGAGLRWIRTQRAGWYSHTLRNRLRQVTVSICVGYRTYRRDEKRRTQKQLFAAWKISGEPTEIRERYRKRFGIEASYRQLHQARIYTCTRCPRLRFVFIAVALILRNVWVWIHQTKLTRTRNGKPTTRPQPLQFKRMLDWIAQAVQRLLHDGADPCIAWPP